MDDRIEAKKNFGVVDFTVFVGLLLISTIIGIFFAYRDRKKSSTSNYYYGEGKMNPVAVGLSLSVTYMSAVSLTALPAEVYIAGNGNLVGPAAIFFVTFFCIVYFIPAYHRLDVATVYEYLEMRYNAATRRLSAALVTVSLIFYIGINIYLPSLTVSAVTPLPLRVSVAVCTIVCTFYTAIGGMKTVVWTDVFQSLIMLLGMGSVFFKTLHVIGGIESLQETLENGQRTVLTKPDYDIRSRSSAFGLFVALFTFFLHVMNFSQPVVQRFQSCKSVGAARWAMAVYWLPTSLLMLLSVGSGCVMYAYFQGCDPVKSGKLESLDQGMPYLALLVFENAPGMAGLFTAAIFSGSLSTVSSAMNSLAVMFIKDFVSIKWPNLSDRVKLLTSKITVVVLGVLVMIIAYIIPLFQSNIVRLIITLMGLINGPLLGLFLLGFFFPWTNSLGAIIGAATGFVLQLWTIIGAFFLRTGPRMVPLPPVSTELCPAVSSNATMSNMLNITSTYATSTDIYINTTTEVIDNDSYTFDQMVYSISYLHYMWITTAITIVVGLIASFLTGRNKPAEMDPKLFIPLVDNPILPDKVRKFFRFGVPELEKDRSMQFTENELQFVCTGL